MEDTNDPVPHYKNGLDPLSRQYRERNQKYEGNKNLQGATPIRKVSMEPRFNPDTLPRGPVGPPGGTLPVLRSAGGQISPAGKGAKPQNSHQPIGANSHRDHSTSAANHKPSSANVSNINQRLPNYSQSQQMKSERRPPEAHSQKSQFLSKEQLSHHPHNSSASDSHYVNLQDTSLLKLQKNTQQPVNHTHPQQPAHPHLHVLNHSREHSTSSLLPLPSPASGHSTHSGGHASNRGIDNHIMPNFDSQSQQFEVLRKTYYDQDKLFEDKEFPAEDSSLYFSRRPPYRFQWLRPKEIAGAYRLPAELFVGGSSRFDLRQGELGDCWVLAAAACLSEHQELLEGILPPGQSFHSSWYAGMFLFRFWYNGAWKDIIIDDRLPTVQGRLVFVHSTSPNEFWGALLEKAYAKLFGSYEALKGGHVGDALQDFTGGIVESYILDRVDPPLPTNFVNIVFKALEQKSLLGCGINPVTVGRVQETVLPNGLVCGHAYSITDLREIQLISDRGVTTVTLVRVRNPWGTKVEWKGAWSDRSPQWNSIPPQDRAAMGLTFRDDGEFWMEWSDFLKNFHNLDICYLNPESISDGSASWKVNMFHGKWRKGVNAGGRPSLRDTHWTNPQYRVILADFDDDDDKCSFIVELQQKDRRKLKHKNLDYVSIGFVIYQLSKSYKSPLPQRFFDRHRYVERCDYFTNARTVSKRLLMKPGEYVIVPSTFDANVEADFLVRISFEKNNTARDVDEPVEVIDPEPQPSDPITKDQEDTFKHFFYEAAGEDMEIDAFELRMVVNKGLSHDPNHRDLSIDACKAMLILVDVNKNGKLGFFEFKYLWNMLRSWKKLFYVNDDNKNKTIDGFELRKAIASQGYRLSSSVLDKLLTRYGNEHREINLDDFIVCMSKILSLFNVFKVYHKDGEAHFDLNGWMEATVSL